MAAQKIEAQIPHIHVSNDDLYFIIKLLCMILLYNKKNNAIYQGYRYMNIYNL